MPPRIPDAEARQVMLDAGLEPLEPYPGSGTPWRCRCGECDSEITPRHRDVKRGRGGCIHCGGYGPVDRDEANQRMIAKGVTPLEPFRGSHTPWRCQCVTCGAEVTPTYRNTMAGKVGCLSCSYEARGKASRTPAGDAVAVMAAVGLTPLEPYPGALKPWKSRCDACGKEVAPRYDGVRHGKGCAYCAGRAVDEDDAIAVMRDAGVTPLEPYPGSGTPWRCRCDECGEEVTPRYGDAKAGQGGCRFCAPAGFDAKAPASVYLVQQPELSAVKIGITGLDTKRMDQHRHQGWEVVATWEFEVGSRAEKVEGTVLSWWRNELEAPQALAREDMPIGGATETAWLADVEIDETVAFIERLIAAG